MNFLIHQIGILWLFGLFILVFYPKLLIKFKKYKAISEDFLILVFQLRKKTTHKNIYMKLLNL
jgi:hypothetical protein